MIRQELEQLRRSIVMVEGNSAGPVSNTTALLLTHEVTGASQEIARYRQAVAQLRRVLDALSELESGPTRNR